MNYKKLIAVTIALTVCAFAGSNVTAHGGGGGGGHGGGFGGGGGSRGGGFHGGVRGGGFSGVGCHGHSNRSGIRCRGLHDGCLRASRLSNRRSSHRFFCP